MNRRNFVLNGAALVGAGFAGAAFAQSPVVRFGQSASLSGGQARYGQDVRDGMLAAFAAANKADTGLRYELVTLDDGGDKERCKANVKQLVDSGVTALLGLTSGAAAEACLPFIEDNKVVMLGTASGNMGIRSDKLTMAYHVRPGYDVEYRRMVSYIKEFNMRRVGYVYLKDTSPANQAAMTAALDEVGLRITTAVPIDRNQTSFEAQVQALMSSNLECVMFTTNAQPISAIVTAMTAARYTGFHFSSSFAGQALINDMANKRQNIIMSQVVPRPNAVAYVVVKRYAEDLAALDSKARTGFTSLEGYIAARVAIETARRAKSGNRAKFHDALDDLDVDLGGYRVNFTQQAKRGSRFVDVVAIDRTGRIIG